MSVESVDVSAALEWYKVYLSSERDMPKIEITQRLRWIEHFCNSLPKRALSVDDITVREIVLYFADQSHQFQKPLEWYLRYKTLESFWDDMVTANLLKNNSIKGIYDDSDVEPYDEDATVVDAPSTPVNWSRAETLY